MSKSSAVVARNSHRVVCLTIVRQLRKLFRLFLILFRMLTIRLSRHGRKNLPAYKIIVQEKIRNPKTNYLEIIGHYDPRDTKNTLNLKKERLEHYLKNGAQPSDTIARLLKKAGLVTGKKVDTAIHRYTKQKSKSAAEAKAA